MKAISSPVTVLPEPVPAELGSSCWAMFQQKAIFRTP